MAYLIAAVLFLLATIDVAFTVEYSLPWAVPFGLFFVAIGLWLHGGRPTRFY